MEAWWNSNYLMRRRVTFTAGADPLPAGQEIEVPLDLNEFVLLNKVLPSYEDIAVVHQSDGATLVFTVLPHLVGVDSVVFQTAESVDPFGASISEYFIYYANPDLENIPSPSTYESNPWPSSIAFNDKRVTYTNPGEDWSQGRSVVHNAKATFRFNGTAVRLVSKIGPAYGRAAIFMDDKLTEIVDLFSPDLGEKAVYSNINLDDGRHSIQVYVVYDKDPASLGYEVNILKFDLDPSYAVEALEEFITTDWVSYLGGN